jgi:predicted glutamine amidotransferase
MNCAAPTDFSFSFLGFCQRGGATDIHAHGFGLSIYEGRGVRTFVDTLPAAESPIAKMVQSYPIRTYVSSIVNPAASFDKLRNEKLA